MFIYLDTMIVQYCADYEDFIFGVDDRNPVSEPKLAAELLALRRLAELEQFGNWSFAAPAHLMSELLAGRPTVTQQRVYALLLQTWQESGWKEFFEASEGKVLSIDHSLISLELQDAADRRHLAEAIALGASWFLTNDKNILHRTRKECQETSQVRQVRVARPSECVGEISVGLFLG
jgi:hypothetical protein